MTKPTPEVTKRARAMLRAGASFRTVLYQSGVTQRELADALGLVPPRISRILGSLKEARKQGLDVSLGVYRWGCERLGLRLQEVPEVKPLLKELKDDHPRKAAAG